MLQVLTAYVFGLSGLSLRDASGSACGSFIEFEGKIFHQNWSDFEKAQSSTFRELLAVSLSMKVESPDSHVVYG